MQEEEKKNAGEEKGIEQERSGQVSRRQFLKDAGLLVGGAIGSMAVLSSCSKGAAAVAGVTTAVTTGSTTVVVTTPAVTTSTAPAVTGLTTLIVNGKTYYVNVKPNWTLLYVLREKLGLTGTKRGCDEGSCGMCTILMDSRPILTCLTLAVEADSKQLKTIEGIAATDLSPLQKAFIQNDAMQCGYCAPGNIMAATALLAFNPKPTPDLIKECLAGNLCRCGSYKMIVAAVQQAAGA